MSAACNNMSPRSLVRSLVASSREVESLEKPRQWQIHDASCIARRIKLLSVLFEEIDGAGSYDLPPSAALCFRELWTTIQKAKALLENCANRSRIWNIMEADSVCRRFQELAREMARALDILPPLDVAEDVREHVELLHRQARKPPRQEAAAPLRRELLDAVRDFQAKKAPDPDRLRAAFRRLGLDTPADCRREIRKLQHEAAKQDVKNLVGLVVYAKCVLFGVEEQEQEQEEDEGEAGEGGGPEFESPAAPPCDGRIPDEMRCPISLELMRDPVVVATGHTYDRASIRRWLDSGHSTCPTTGQALPHGCLIPNYALRSLISRWCQDRHVCLEGNIPTPDAARMRAAFLVGKLATGSAEAACELRLLAKHGTEDRKCIAEAGAVPLLVRLLSSGDARAQENAVTALLNLSIYGANKALIMSAPGALDAVVGVLERGLSTESRENAAAALFSLTVADEFKAAVGNRSDAVAALVRLLAEGTPRGKRDAATALFNLSVCAGNRAAVVAAGAVPLLVRLLTDEAARVTDDALAVLALLAASAEGLAAIRAIEGSIPVLVDLTRAASSKGRENAAAVLVALCRSGGQDMVRRLLLIPSTVPSLNALVSLGSLRAKRKAASLLKLLNASPHRR